jgi:hypothetical protein
MVLFDLKESPFLNYFVLGMFQPDISFMEKPFTPRPLAQFTPPGPPED